MALGACSLAYGDYPHFLFPSFPETFLTIPVRQGSKSYPIFLPFSLYPIPARHCYCQSFRLTLSHSYLFVRLWPLPPRGPQLMRWPFSPVSYNTLLNAWCSTTRLSALPARYSGQLLDKFIWSSNLEYLPCAMNLLLLYSFQQSSLVSGPIL